MKFIISLLINGLAVWLGAWLLDGVWVDGYLWAIITGAILAIINITIKPILTFLTLPITIITLGLFLLIINALMILLTDWILPGFEVDGFLWALIFSIVVWLINLVFQGFNLK